MIDTKKTEWFLNDRFGMFIHWGVYSITARSEHFRSHMQMSDSEYHKYAERFNPVKFNPREWAKIAKNAGMKYAVLTAKHHDGFCMFDSQYTEFKITNTPYGKDIVREFIDAFRAEGLKVGLYYSLLDWDHPDYPHYKHQAHPMRDNEDYKDYKYNFDNYVSYLHNQVRELCTNYGKLDILWFDYSYQDMIGEKWKSTELIRMVRKLQPEIIVDTRLGTGGDTIGSIATDNPTEYCGDFASCEQILPPEPMCNIHGELLPWEACITTNSSWGYNIYDHRYKSATTIIHSLVDCVSKGGNLLLNVGPNSYGEIPQEAISLLNEVGKWMDVNSESIYGCTLSSFKRPDYGRITQKDNTLYIHIFDQIIGPVYIKNLKIDDIESATLLESGADLTLLDEWVTKNFPDYLYMCYCTEKFSTIRQPDEHDTVIKLVLKK